ncbi:MAG: tRNA pseudouridine(38-40) synthase TruA [Lachnospira sp.]
MRRIKLVVAYDGTNYSGWQIQPKAKTIEAVLDDAINCLTGEKVHVIGASRTDAGVHAMGNVAVFDTESKIPGEKFAFALNRFLPEDVSIQSSREVSSDFHPRHCNTRKTYRYRILNTKMPVPQLRNYTWHVDAPLNINRMRAAARYLVGEHDFKSFCCVRTQVESTVRTIYDIRITADYGQQVHRSEDMGCGSLEDSGEIEGGDRIADGDRIQDGYRIQDWDDPVKDDGTKELVNGEITIEITGNGFLYNMVRIIAGTLIQVGKGRFEPVEVKKMLLAEDRTMAGQTAPPQGLTLMNIEYVDGDDKAYSKIKESGDEV